MAWCFYGMGYVITHPPILHKQQISNCTFGDVVLCCVLLCCVVLCCVVLCRVVLCCVLWCCGFVVLFMVCSASGCLIPFSQKCEMNEMEHGIICFCHSGEKCDIHYYVMI